MSSVFTSMSGIIAMSDIVIISHIGIMLGINGRFFILLKVLIRFPWSLRWARGVYDFAYV